jgi:hypothetical protein
MTTFNFSTGDPNNLAAGANASMTDIKGPFVDLKAFLNGANLDGTNIASGGVAATQLATAVKPTTLLGAYATVQDEQSHCGNALADVFRSPQVGGSVMDIGSGTTATTMWLDPAHHAISGLTTKLRLLGTLGTNGTAPLGSWFFALRPVTGFDGGANVVTVTAVGSALGSVGVVTPIANNVTPALGADFDFPAVGPYVFTIHVTGSNQATNSRVALRWTLQKHYV